MAWENSPHFVTLLKCFPREMQKWRLTIKRLQKFHTDDVSLPRSGQVLLIGRAAREIVLQPIRCTPQTRVVTRHHYGISACVPQTSFGGKQPWWRREMSVLFSGYRRNSTRLDLGWLSIPVLCSLLQWQALHLWQAKQVARERANKQRQDAQGADPPKWRACSQAKYSVFKSRI